MKSNLLRLVAWLLLLAIGIVTLSPIGFRPRLPLDVQLERAIAFVGLGLMFALAYPRRIWAAVAVSMVGAFGLELLQEVTPDRHGRLPDAMAKAAGASLGLGTGWLVAQVLERFGSSGSTR